MDITASVKDLANFKDPFKKDCVEQVWIYATRNIFTHEWEFHGSVEFRNGDTKGKQDFKGIDFKDLTNQVQEFLNNL